MENGSGDCGDENNDVQEKAVFPIPRTTFSLNVM